MPMPSPFPGMDPFLEHPAFFPGVHDSFLTYLREALQEVLPAPYFAEINERLWVDTSERSIGPDVDVLRGGSPGTGLHQGNGGVAVLAQPAQPILITVPVEEHRQTYLEIRTPLDDRERVVATIEVLSPANKSPGPKGRTLYLQKQQEILDSDSHLVEIDLLRGGTHTTAVPLDRLRAKAPPFDYHVCVHPFDSIGKFAAYTIRLTECLPAVAVPLLPGDGSVTVNLQTVFGRCYDTGPYRRRVIYDIGRIEPPLHAELLEWATQLVRTQGLPRGQRPAADAGGAPG
jgi:Protein of unknown function (DUF4058)